MPTELEELVEFLHHGNTQIRQIAAENLVGYSQAEPAIFKTNQLTPIKDLKLLVKDYKPIAKNALTMLINLSKDDEVLKHLASDNDLLESLLLRVTNEKEPNADEVAMLLANMAKSDEMVKILTLQRAVPKPLSTSPYAIDQLMDCFVKGAEGSYNKNANYDYLSYLFADLSKFPECRDYFTGPQDRDNGIVPLTKLVVFTEHKSDIRRRGVASTIKNVAFDLQAHARLMASDSVNVLPYILLPLMGPEEYSDEDTEGMLDELQLLEPDKKREEDLEIVKTHLEALLLLTTDRDGRELMRKVKVYPIVRECHLHVDNEEVQEACDRVVQILMRDEPGEGENGDAVAAATATAVDEDEQVLDVA